MQVVETSGKIIALIYRDSDWVKGLNFITPKELFIQVSSWWYDANTKLASHVHKQLPRVINRTHEVTFVKKGAMKVLLYDDNKNLVNIVILNAGDLAVYANGGHGYEILQDDTQIIEAKTGPFFSVELDKEKF